MYKMPLRAISPNMILGQDVFSEENNSIPLLRKGTAISSDYIQKLERRGVSVLYVQSKPIPSNEQTNKSSPSRKTPAYFTRKPAAPSVGAVIKKEVIVPKTRDGALKTLRDLHISISTRDSHSVVNIVNYISKAAIDIVDSVIAGGGG